MGIIDAIISLRPGLEVSVNGEVYKGIIWPKGYKDIPTEQEINDQLVSLKNAKILSDAISKKIKELNSFYDACQIISVVTNNFTFSVPLKGDFFTTVISNQILQAQILGSAPLIVQDNKGNSQVIQDVPFDIWKSFFQTAKKLSFENFSLYTQLTIQINDCTSMDDVNAISVDVFPSIQSISLNI